MNGGRVTVVGSGRMAPGIARSFLLAGADVVIAGRTASRVEAAAALAGGDVQPRPIEAASFEDADLVCESVSEDLGVKQQVFRTIEPWLRPDAILTSNTSGLRISRLSEHLLRPDRFCGLHFLFPADLTGVVEVVAGDQSSMETIESVARAVEQMDKRPIVAHADVPGFVWNRLQLALLREALWLLDHGVAEIAAIDAAVSDGLAPRWMGTGPFACVDLGGSATWAQVADEVFPHLSTSDRPSATLRGLGEAGATFYQWTASDLAKIAALRSATLEVGRNFARDRFLPRGHTDASTPSGGDT